MQIATKEWLKIGMIFFVVALPLFVVNCAGKNDQTFNIAGTWSLFRITPPVTATDTTQATPADEQMDTFTFTTSDKDVQGSTSSGEAITGSVSETDISFATTGTNGLRRDYAGKLSSEGATMAGTWTSTDASGVQTSGTWSAVVHGIPTFNVTGNWNLDEPAGGIEGATGFNFNQPTDKPNDLSGSTLPVTDPNISLKGAVGALDVMFFWENSDGVFVTLTGKINGGNTMSGTWTATDGQSGTWSATKSD